MVAWLDELGVGDIVDLGSGVGKWCVGAALLATTPRRYYGLEHRVELVAVAHDLARSFNVTERVTFHRGEVRALLEAPGPIAGLPARPAFYLFNPFGENTARDDERLDEAVELSEDRFHRDVAATESLLEVALPGTWVLVYNGFGGRMPASYEPVRTDFDGAFALRLWRKRPFP
jgi:predicted RNA methylase